MKEKRPRYIIRLHAVQRLIMWRYLNQRLNLVLVSEHPKCGGTWFSQLLAETLDIPFPRNVRPKLSSCLMHGHLLYEENFNQVIGVIRDGRDVMVSAYYHMLFNNDKNSAAAVTNKRALLNFEDFDDIQSNLPRFIEYMFTDYTKGRFHFSWSEFINSYYGNTNVHIVKYEDLLVDAKNELKDVIHFLGRLEVSDSKLDAIVNKYSFKNVTKRKPGEENKTSFLRKGIAGDWKNHFSAESCKVFDSFAGKELIKAGYEKDHRWF